MIFAAVFILPVITVCIEACFTADTAVNNKTAGSGSKLNSGESFFLSICVVNVFFLYQYITKEVSPIGLTMMNR